VRRPLDAGTRLTLRVRAEDLRPHERGQQLDVVATATVEDDVVWEGRSVYLRRSVGGPPRTRSAAGGTPPEATAVWRVPRQVGISYARASGDQNPIHTSRLLARVFGFPRPIAHGMWTKARCLAALDGRLPEVYTVDVEFKLPVLLPAVVGFSAESDADGWRFAVHDARTGRPHLAGSVVS
jgi:acyl dehydratase